MLANNNNVCSLELGGQNINNLKKYRILIIFIVVLLVLFVTQTIKNKNTVDGMLSTEIIELHQLMNKLESKVKTNNIEKDECLKYIGMLLIYSRNLNKLNFHVLSNNIDITISDLEKVDWKNEDMLKNQNLLNQLNQNVKLLSVIEDEFDGLSNVYLSRYRIEKINKRQTDMLLDSRNE